LESYRPADEWTKVIIAAPKLANRPCEDPVLQNPEGQFYADSHGKAFVIA
jgi:hypothetical protein